MVSIWQALEDLGGGAAVGSRWRALAGEQFAVFQKPFLHPAPAPAASIPCPRNCGCAHEVVRHGEGQVVAVCRCEPWNCEDISLTDADVVLWKLNRAKLGRELSNALGCEAKDADLGLSRTRQIGSFGHAGLPLVLTVQQDRGEFASVVRQLVGLLGERFILLAPTSRHLDGNTRALIRKANAGFFDLESNIELLASGKLRARKSGGELFASLLPAEESDLSESEAKNVFALMKQLDLGSRFRKAPLEKVFRLLVLEDRTQEFAARNCNCAESLISLRVAQIEKKMKRSLSELKAFGSRLGKMDVPVEDSRARNIYRKGLVDGEMQNDE